MLHPNTFDMTCQVQFRGQLSTRFFLISYSIKYAIGYNKCIKTVDTEHRQRQTHHFVVTRDTQQLVSMVVSTTVNLQVLFWHFCSCIHKAKLKPYAFTMAYSEYYVIAHIPSLKVWSWLRACCRSSHSLPRSPGCRRFVLVVGVCPWQSHRS